jgi:hypothetical protein
MEGSLMIKRLLTGIAGIGLVLVAIAPPAAAYRNGTYVGNFATAVVSYDKVDKKAYASYQAGGGGVAAQAWCQRGDLTSALYTSTVFKRVAGSFSTYDCDNNTTYNRALTDNDYKTIA